jgi:YegS/Rv2252/BmrU family lipid kinase
MVEFVAREAAMSKTTVILNPAAGRGSGANLQPRVIEWLENSGLDLELLTTDAPGHARNLARQAAAEGRAAIIAVGGDGTANEVINGLMQAGTGPSGTALGILPIGTGNDFAFGAGIPMDLHEACQVVVRGGTRLLDVGRIQADEEEPLYFGNGAGMGFDAMANIESRKINRLGGYLLYLVAAIRTLAYFYYAPETVIQIDDAELSQPSLMISVMNGRRRGGGFYMTPDSTMDDGLLDLCIATEVDRAKMVSFLPRFMRGTHVTDPAITMTQGRKVIVVSDSPWAAQADGEIYGVGARRYEIELFPQCLRLIC